MICGRHHAMKNFIRKYNLELLTAFMVVVIAITICLPSMSMVRKVLAVYMFLFILHEWEETRFPGGFADLMTKFFGISTSREKLEWAHVPVAVLLVVILLIPYLFDSIAMLTLIPAFLGILEGVIHIVGIKLHKMTKPYTPGMVTALCLFAVSVWVFWTFATMHLVSGSDFLLGAVCMFLAFVCMQRTVIAIYGLHYSDLIKFAKKKLGK